VSCTLVDVQRRRETLEVFLPKEIAGEQR